MPQSLLMSILIFLTENNEQFWIKQEIDRRGGMILKWIKGIAAALTSALIGTASLTAFAAVTNPGMEICYDGATHLYTGEIYKLYVNGDRIDSLMDPIIFNDRALVPVREIFEHCGADVAYTDSSKCIEVQYDTTYIRMYVNDNVAYVNGKMKGIPDDIVPKLISKPGQPAKTMVPVRFISETVGLNVDFYGDDGVISVSDEGTGNNYVPEVTEQPVYEEPEPTEEPTAEPTPEPVRPLITSITNRMLSATSMKVTVKADRELEGSYSYFTLSDPERVVVDFADAQYEGSGGTISTNGDGIKSVRIGTTDERTRVVIDVENLISYDVKPVSDKTVEITIKVSGAPAVTPTPQPSKSTNTSAATESAQNSSYGAGIVKATAADKKKVIMLDAGHGGSDPGAIGTLNGRTVNEKDLTLSITYKVKAILEANGYVTSMTRTGDTLPSLAERPAQANEEGCALFISIHINSAEATEAHGTEVYWSQENVDATADDGLRADGKDFAQYVLDGMLKYTKSYNRGVRQANWAVTRRSQMPAVLAEVGFISNENELSNMVDDDYQNKVATGIAEGIINMLHAL